VKRQKKYEIHREEILAYNHVQRLKNVYGLTIEAIDAMLLKQDHKCPICQVNLKEARRHIDHDHTTGKVRSILCSKCNLALGFVENTDWLKAALLYLERNK
jgi:hypothetical protein